MISLKRFKEVFNSSKISDDYFLNLHFLTEAYFKRLLMIWFRREGLDYKTAKSTIEALKVGSYNLVKTVEKLILNSDKDDIGKKYSDYERLRDFYLNYSAKWRNKRAHGSEDIIKNDEFLKLLICIDKLFIKKFEEILKKEKGLSAFNTPREWGAKRVTKKDDKKVRKILKGCKFKVIAENEKAIREIKEEAKNWFNENFADCTPDKIKI